MLVYCFLMLVSFLLSHVSVLLSHVSVLLSHVSVLLSHVSVLLSHVSGQQRVRWGRHTESYLVHSNNIAIPYIIFVLQYNRNTYSSKRPLCLICALKVSSVPHPDPFVLYVL